MPKVANNSSGYAKDSALLSNAVELVLPENPRLREELSKENSKNKSEKLPEGLLDKSLGESLNKLVSELGDARFDRGFNMTYGQATQDNNIYKTRLQVASQQIEDSKLKIKTHLMHSGATPEEQKAQYDKIRAFAATRELEGLNQFQAAKTEYQRRSVEEAEKARREGGASYALGEVLTKATKSASTLIPTTKESVDILGSAIFSGGEGIEKVRLKNLSERGESVLGTTEEFAKGSNSSFSNTVALMGVGLAPLEKVSGMTLNPALESVDIGLRASRAASYNAVSANDAQISYGEYKELEDREGLLKAAKLSMDGAKIALGAAALGPSSLSQLSQPMLVSGGMGYAGALSEELLSKEGFKLGRFLEHGFTGTADSFLFMGGITGIGHIAEKTGALHKMSSVKTLLSLENGVQKEKKLEAIYKSFKGLEITNDEARFVSNLVAEMKMGLSGKIDLIDSLPDVQKSLNIFLEKVGDLSALEIYEKLKKDPEYRRMLSGAVLKVGVSGFDAFDVKSGTKGMESLEQTGRMEDGKGESSTVIPAQVAGLVTAAEAQARIQESLEKTGRIEGGKEFKNSELETFAKRLEKSKGVSLVYDKETLIKEQAGALYNPDEKIIYAPTDAVEQNKVTKQLKHEKIHAMLDRIKDEGGDSFSFGKMSLTGKDTTLEEFVTYPEMLAEYAKDIRKNLGNLDSNLNFIKEHVQVLRDYNEQLNKTLNIKFNSDLEINTNSGILDKVIQTFQNIFNFGTKTNLELETKKRIDKDGNTIYVKIGTIKKGDLSLSLDLSIASDRNNLNSDTDAKKLFSEKIETLKFVQKTTSDALNKISKSISSNNQESLISNIFDLRSQLFPIYVTSGSGVTAAKNVPTGTKVELNKTLSKEDLVDKYDYVQAATHSSVAQALELLNNFPNSEKELKEFIKNTKLNKSQIKKIEKHAVSIGRSLVENEELNNYNKLTHVNSLYRLSHIFKQLGLDLLNNKEIIAAISNRNKAITDSSAKYSAKLLVERKVRNQNFISKHYTIVRPQKEQTEEIKQEENETKEIKQEENVHLLKRKSTNDLPDEKKTPVELLKLQIKNFQGITDRIQTNLNSLQSDDYQRAEVYQFAENRLIILIEQGNFKVFSSLIELLRQNEFELADFKKVHDSLNQYYSNKSADILIKSLNEDLNNLPLSIKLNLIKSRITNTIQSEGFLAFLKVSAKLDEEIRKNIFADETIKKLAADAIVNELLDPNNSKVHQVFNENYLNFSKDELKDISNRVEKLKSIDSERAEESTLTEASETDEIQLSQFDLDNLEEGQIKSVFYYSKQSASIFLLGLDEGLKTLPQSVKLNVIKYKAALIFKDNGFLSFIKFAKKLDTEFKQNILADETIKKLAADAIVIELVNPENSKVNKAFQDNYLNFSKDQLEEIRSRVEKLKNSNNHSAEESRRLHKELFKDGDKSDREIMRAIKKLGYPTGISKDEVVGRFRDFIVAGAFDSIKLDINRFRNKITNAMVIEAIADVEELPGSEIERTKNSADRPSIVRFYQSQFNEFENEVLEDIEKNKLIDHDLSNKIKLLIRAKHVESIYEMRGIRLSSILEDLPARLWEEQFIKYPSEYHYFLSRLSSEEVKSLNANHANTFLKIAGIQAQSADKDNNPWVTEFESLVKHLIETKKFKYEEPKTGDTLIEFVSQFGMVNTPELANVFFDLSSIKDYKDQNQDTKNLINNLFLEAKAINEAKSTNKISIPEITELTKSQDIKKFLISYKQTLLVNLINEEESTLANLDSELSKNILESILETSFDRDSIDIPSVIKTLRDNLNSNKRSFSLEDYQKEKTIDVKLVRKKIGVDEAAINKEKERALANPDLIKVSTNLTQTISKALEAIDSGKENALIVEEIQEALKNLNQRLLEIQNGLIKPDLTENAKKGISINLIKTEADIKLLNILLNNDSFDQIIGKLDSNNQNHLSIIQAISTLEIVKSLPEETLNQLQKVCNDNVSSEIIKESSLRFLANFINNNITLSKDLKIQEAWKVKNLSKHPIFVTIAKIKELDNSTNEVLNDTGKILMVPVKGLLHVMSGFISDACTTGIANNLAAGKEPSVTTYLFVTDRGTSSEKVRGAVLGIETFTPDGKKVLVIRANNPKQGIGTRFDTDSLLEQTVEYFKNMAVEGGFDYLVVPVDGTGESGSNRDFVSDYYQENYSKNEKLQLIQSSETELNRYSNFNSKGPNAVRVVWSREAEEKVSDDVSLDVRSSSKTHEESENLNSRTSNSISKTLSNSISWIFSSGKKSNVDNLKELITQSRSLLSQYRVYSLEQRTQLLTPKIQEINGLVKQRLDELNLKYTTTTNFKLFPELKKEFAGIEWSIFIIDPEQNSTNSIAKYAKKIDLINGGQLVVDVPRLIINQYDAVVTNDIHTLSVNGLIKGEIDKLSDFHEYDHLKGRKLNADGNSTPYSGFIESSLFSKYIKSEQSSDIMVNHDELLAYTKNILELVKRGDKLKNILHEVNSYKNNFVDFYKKELALFSSPTTTYSAQGSTAYFTHVFPLDKITIHDLVLGEATQGKEKITFFLGKKGDLIALAEKNNLELKELVELLIKERIKELLDITTNVSAQVETFLKSIEEINKSKPKNYKKIIDDKCLDFATSLRFYTLSRAKSTSSDLLENYFKQLNKNNDSALSDLLGDLDSEPLSALDLKNKYFKDESLEAPHITTNGKIRYVGSREQLQEEYKALLGSGAVLNENTVAFYDPKFKQTVSIIPETLRNKINNVKESVPRDQRVIEASFIIHEKTHEKLSAGKTNFSDAERFNQEVVCYRAQAEYLFDRGFIMSFSSDGYSIEKKLPGDNILSLDENLDLSIKKFINAHYNFPNYVTNPYEVERLASFSKELLKLQPYESKVYGRDFLEQSDLPENVKLKDLASSQARLTRMPDVEGKPKFVITPLGGDGVYKNGKKIDTETEINLFDKVWLGSVVKLHTWEKLNTDSIYRRVDRPKFFKDKEILTVLSYILDDDILHSPESQKILTGKRLPKDNINEIADIVNQGGPIRLTLVGLAKEADSQAIVIESIDLRDPAAPIATIRNPGQGMKMIVPWYSIKDRLAYVPQYYQVEKNNTSAPLTNRPFEAMGNESVLDLIKELKTIDLNNNGKEKIENVLNRINENLDKATIPLIDRSGKIIQKLSKDVIEDNSTLDISNVDYSTIKELFEIEAQLQSFESAGSSMSTIRSYLNNANTVDVSGSILAEAIILEHRLTGLPKDFTKQVEVYVRFIGLLKKDIAEAGFNQDKNSNTDKSVSNLYDSYIATDGKLSKLAKYLKNKNGIYGYEEISQGIINAVVENLRINEARKLKTALDQNLDSFEQVFSTEGGVHYYKLADNSAIVVRDNFEDDQALVRKAENVFFVAEDQVKGIKEQLKAIAKDGIGIFDFQSMALAAGVIPFELIGFQVAVGVDGVVTAEVVNKNSQTHLGGEIVETKI